MSDHHYGTTLPADEAAAVASALLAGEGIRSIGPEAGVVLCYAWSKVFPESPVMGDELADQPAGRQLTPAEIEAVGEMQDCALAAQDGEMQAAAMEGAAMGVVLKLLLDLAAPILIAWLQQRHQSGE